MRKFALFVFGLMFFLAFASAASEGFYSDSVLLKTAIKVNSSYDGQIRITNIDNKAHFSLKIIDLGNLAFLDINEFDLDKGETRAVNVKFRSSDKTSAGIYTGALEISSGADKKSIPIILEVESKDTSFDSNIALYPVGLVSAGEKINAEMKVFDLTGAGIATIQLEYFVKSFNGQTIASGKENVIVKDQALVTKSIDLPLSALAGDYVFGIILKHKNSVATASAFFRVGEKESNFVLSDNFYLIIIFLIVIFMLLLFLLYSMYSRDKLVDELKKQYEGELKRQEDYILKRQKESERKLRTREEKLLNSKLFEQVLKKRKELVGEIHKKRIEKIKNLRKSNNSGEMAKQILEWRKKGYDTSVLDKQVPNVSDIQRKIREYKKKGYDTSVLERNFK